MYNMSALTGSRMNVRVAENGSAHIWQISRRPAVQRKILQSGSVPARWKCHTPPCAAGSPSWKNLYANLGCLGKSYFPRSANFLTRGHPASHSGDRTRSSGVGRRLWLSVGREPINPAAVRAVDRGWAWPRRHSHPRRRTVDRSHGRGGPYIEDHAPALVGARTCYVPANEPAARPGVRPA